MNSGFNTPHTHPRATELAIVVKGRMISEFVQETGARKIRNVSTKLSHSSDLSLSIIHIESIKLTYLRSMVSTLWHSSPKELSI
jgi:hypothetical protein